MAESAAKALLPNQCNILHQYYPVSECCLCDARQRIEELEAEIAKLKEELSDLNTSV